MNMGEDNRKLAVDVALLLPDELNKVCVDINRRPEAEAFSDLSKENNHPHITLAMGVVNEKDIIKVDAKLKKIVRGFSPLTLQITDIFDETTPEKKKSCCFTVAMTDGLKRLHARVMKTLFPVFSYDAGLDMFYRDPDETLHEVSKYWVENYGKKHQDPDNYHPHISLKCRRGNYEQLPIKFVADKMVLCHLGNYCTCRAILGSFNLGVG